MVDTTRYVTVNGKPFFILGGQVHNSSAYTRERMAPLWDTLVRMQANTAEVPVYWEQVEPVEGAFDFTIVDDLIVGAREHDLRLILLWFGTWKNGTMKYTPGWVKQQPDRFRRVITPEGLPLPVLSPHCRATLEADKRAVCALLDHIKKLDGSERTVIMLQVENEPGSHGAERDFSQDSNTLFAAAVPESLIASLPSTRSALQQTWEENGARTHGSWQEVFGRMAAETFSAWSVARYIDEIAAAAKDIYDLPMYVNVWLGEIGFRVAGYDYPSGGAVSQMIDVWKAAAPHIDLLAPDIYFADAAQFCQICETYSRPDNPLFIPECGRWPATSRQMFYAIAKYNAIGIAPFGIDGLVDKDGNVIESCVALVDSFAAIRAILPLIPAYQGTGRMHAIVQEEGALMQYIELDGYNALVQFGVSWYGRPIPAGGAHETDRGRGLLIQSGPKEFYVTGIGFTVYIRPVTGFHRFLYKDRWQGRFDPWLLVETGHFEGEQWVVDERRSGDETDFGLILATPGQVVHAVFD
jgi:uncharacterized protein YukE